MQPDPSWPLTARERQVIGLYADGLTRPEIAKLLGVTFHTVREHTDNARAKLGASTIAHAVAICYQHNLLDRRLAA